MTNFNDSEIYLFEDSLYLLTEKPLTWGEAQTEAQDLGGHLAAINSRREQIFLSSLFLGQRSWIGLSDAGSEGNFTWTTGEPVNFKKWNSGRPLINNASANFVAMSSGGTWADFGGTRKYQGIIEIKNPSKPVIAIEDLGIIEPYGGTKEAVFQVKVFGEITSPIIINYATQDETAFANSDYTPTSGQLVFNPGDENTKSISVTVRGDSDDVSNEKFFVNLSSSDNAILGRRQAEATIRERSEVKTFGSSAYLLTDSADSWGKAREEARTFGKDLVTINTPEEQTFLSGAYGDKRRWIGLSDAAEEGEFDWGDGKTAYRNWSTGRPLNNNTANFVAMSSGGTWADFGGTQNYQGIIETSISELDVNNPLNTPVYRFYNTQAGGHFFTTSEEERDFVTNNLPQYNFEGVGMNASNIPGDDLLEVHRFYNTQAGGHFFTTSTEERDFVIDNLLQYNYEGVGFYAYGSETNLGADIYRFYNTQAGGHFFTSSPEERDFVINNLPQYNYEGIGFEAGFA